MRRGPEVGPLLSLGGPTVVGADEAVNMRERIRELRHRLQERATHYDNIMRHDTLPQQAASAFVRRARSLETAIWLLLENGAIAEAAILFRSQINLLWCFLFMIDARSIDGHYEFDADPPKESPFYRRAAKYLSWHWVDLHRRTPSPRSKEMLDRLVQEHGYASEADVPAFWYLEHDIRTIKHLAAVVGGLPQYEQDYSHLSGIEHSDVTAVIVEGMDGDRYGERIAFKSSQILEAVMDFAIRICGCTGNGAWQELVEVFNIVADDLSREARPTREGA